MMNAESRIRSYEEQGISIGDMPREFMSNYDELVGSVKFKSSDIPDKEYEEFLESKDNHELMDFSHKINQGSRAIKYWIDRSPDIEMPAKEVKLMVNTLRDFAETQYLIIKRMAYWLGVPHDVINSGLGSRAVMKASVDTVISSFGNK